MRFLVALALALAFLAPGCIFQKGVDDISVVCEVKAESPGPAYATDGLVAATTVDPAIPDALARKALDAVRPHVVTLGRHAHAHLAANLTRESNTTLRFVAEGRDAAGSLVDDYNLTLEQLDGGFSVSETRPTLEPIGASPAMIRAAMAAVNRTTELAALPQRTPTMVASGWSPDAPSCVKLLYQDGPSDAITPATDEHPHTLVVVSLVTNRVVAFTRDHWSA